LERKFGPLANEKRHQIENANPETLFVWLDRILTANSLEDVLS
jgi:hypothetical protein